MDLRIPAALDSKASHAAKRKKPESDAPKDAPREKDPIADKVSVDGDLLAAVKAALEGKADKPKSKKSKDAEPTVTVRYLPQDDLLPDRQEEVALKDVGTDLTGERFKTMEDTSGFRAPMADKAGNYLFSLGDPRQGAVNAHVSANKALDIAEKYLGRKIDWGFERKSAPEQLWIHPHAGEGMNAFYNNKNGSINFLYAEDPSTKEIIDTSTSMEVVAHETGHAILDGLRPKYIDSLDTSSSGFHEAFGDCIAMLASLSDDDVVEQLYQETRGNLGKPNIVSNMGEQLGRAMRGEEKPYVRSLLNDHTSRDPHFMPFMAFPDGPALEPHAHSQSWTGAIYDLLRLVTHEETEDSQKPFVDAVRNARDTVGSLVMRGVELGPVGKISFKDAAASMLTADVIDNGGAHLEKLLAVFTSRGIFSADDADRFTTDLASTKALRKEVTLPEGFDPKKDAKKLLADHAEALGLSSADRKSLKFDRMVSNDKGEKIVQYTEQRDVELTDVSWGAEYQGSSFSINGGLLLAFNKDNELIAMNRDAITEDSVEDSKLFLKKMMDFQKNPPIVIHGEKDGVKAKDLHLDYMLTSAHSPLEVVNGHIRHSGVLYCNCGDPNHQH